MYLHVVSYHVENIKQHNPLLAICETRTILRIAQLNFLQRLEMRLHVPCSSVIRVLPMDHNGNNYKCII